MRMARKLMGCHGKDWKRKQRNSQQINALIFFAGKKKFLCVLQTSARLWRRHWKACRISMELSIRPPWEYQWWPKLQTIPAATVWEWLNSLKIPLGRTYNGGDQWGSSCYWVVCIARYNHQDLSIRSILSIFPPLCWLKYLKTCYHLVMTNIAMENHHF